MLVFINIPGLYLFLTYFIRYTPIAHQVLPASLVDSVTAKVGDGKIDLTDLIQQNSLMELIFGGGFLNIFLSGLNYLGYISGFKLLCEIMYNLWKICKLLNSRNLNERNQTININANLGHENLDKKHRSSTINDWRRALDANGSLAMEDAPPPYI